MLLFLQKFFSFITLKQTFSQQHQFKYLSFLSEVTLLQDTSLYGGMHHRSPELALKNITQVLEKKNIPVACSSL